MEPVSSTFLEVRLRPVGPGLKSFRAQISYLSFILGPFERLDDLSVSQEGDELISVVNFSDKPTAALAHSVFDGVKLNRLARLTARLCPSCPELYSALFRSQPTTQQTTHTSPSDESKGSSTRQPPSLIPTNSFLPPIPGRRFSADASSNQLLDGGFTHPPLRSYPVSNFQPATNKADPRQPRYWNPGLNLVPVKSFDADLSLAETPAISPSDHGRHRWTAWSSALETFGQGHLQSRRVLSAIDIRYVFNSSKEVANFFGLFGSISRSLLDPSQRILYAEFEAPEQMKQTLSRIDFHEICHGLGLELRQELLVSLDFLPRHITKDKLYVPSDRLLDPRSIGKGCEDTRLGSTLLIWTLDRRVLDCDQFGSTLKGEVCRIRRPETFRSANTSGLPVPVYHVGFASPRDAVVVYLRLRGGKVKGFSIIVSFSHNVGQR